MVCNGIKNVSIDILPIAAFIRAAMMDNTIIERMMYAMTNNNEKSLDQLIKCAETIPLEDENMIGYYLNHLSRLPLKDVLALFSPNSEAYEKADRLLSTLRLTAQRDTLSFGEIMIYTDRYLTREKREEALLQTILDLNYMFAAFSDLIDRDINYSLVSEAKEVMCNIPILSSRNILKKRETEVPNSVNWGMLRKNSIISIYLNEGYTFGNLIKNAYDLASGRLQQLLTLREGPCLPPTCNSSTYAAYNLTKHFLINPVRTYADRHRNVSDTVFLLTEE